MKILLYMKIYRGVFVLPFQVPLGVELIDEKSMEYGYSRQNIIEAVWVDIFGVGQSTVSQ